MPVRPRITQATRPLDGCDPSVLSGKADGANSETFSLPLRIIYTLNSSPQPLLARLRQKTLVMALPDTEFSLTNEHDTTRAPRYGRVFLKTCLAAICASSPELLSDSSRDYSIYVVDPLESISGLSVGVGLLSWWLKDDRSLCNAGEENDVVGKIVEDRGAESLEIRMSLKETTPQSPEDHAKSLSLLAAFNDGQTENTSGSTKSTSGEKNTSSKRYRESNKTRIGRPPGASTNPEKKARRNAILEQKEALKKLQNLAQMQKGEPFDRTVITFADANAPKVTEEDIARQKQIVNDLESRPASSRQATSFLTTKPLPSRTASPAASLPNPQHMESKERGENLHTPNHARGKPSGSNSQANAPTVVSQSPISTTLSPGMVADKQSIEALLSLLSSMLSKIDIPSAKPSNKGKENEFSPKVDPTLVASLGQFLPLLAASSGNSLFGQKAMHSSSFHSSSPHPRPWSFHQGSSISESQRLFQTADETFNISNISTCQFTKHTPNYVSAKPDPPKVRDDAHPVPGGGWARGRNLVPRTPVPSSSSVSNRQSEQSSSTSNPHPKRNKENKPPLETVRGIKRSSPASTDKESGTSKRNTKKPRVEDKSPSNDEEIKILGIKRITVGQNLPNVICDIASSPVRSSRSRVRTSLTAVSEPDFQGPSVPLLAISDLPIPEPPRTPPRKNNATTLKSLFTPATPSNAITQSSAIFDGASLFTPSPVRVGSSNKLLARFISHPAAVDSEPFTMKPGWDLPPSSPPPTSPILSAADLTDEPTILTTSGNAPQIMDKDGSRQFPRSSSPSGFFPSSTASSDFERLSEFSDTLEPAEPSLPDDIVLDIDELWNSLGPIIVQAQLSDNDTLNDNLSSDCNFSHVVTESQNGIDAAKLAEDLKALFGGCVV